MANRRFIDFPIAASVGDNDIVLIWQDGMNKQTTKGTLIQGAPTSLEGLTDVDIAGLINGQILQYNSTTGKWENVDRTDINLSELGDVSIVSPTNGQVLVYNSSTSKWENSSGGFVPYTGAVTTVDLGAQGLRAGYIRFDTSVVSVPDEQGLVYWDQSRSTAALIMNGVLQHIGQDTFFYVKNSTGSSIAKGTAVRFNGTDGASGHLLIAPFLANGTYPSNYFMGVTAETIANGAFGQVMHFGELDGINTSGYTAGALLYASTTTAGGFQTTAPVAPNNIVLIAAAINSKNNGTILVRPTYGSNINQDEGVKITTPTTGDLLQLQAGGLWENKTKAQILGGTSAQFVKGDGSLDSTNYLPLTGGTLTGGLNGTSAAFTGNVSSTTGVFSDVAFYAKHSGSTSTIIGHNGIQGDADGFVVANSTKGFRINFPNNNSYTHTLPNASGTIALTSQIPANPVGGTGTTNYLPKFTGSTTIGNSQVFDNGTNVGIGTTSISGTYEKLAVAGGISIKDNTNAKLEIGRYNTTGAQNSYIKLGANSNSLRFTNNTDIADLMELTNSGNLGLGVTPSAWASGFTAMQVRNASFWSTGNDASITANAYYDGSNYRFIGNAGASRVYHNTDGSIGWSQVASGTAGNAISFTQAMTLTSGGNLLVGTTTDIGQRLQVSGGYITQVDGGVRTFLGYDGSGSLVGTTTNHYLRFITNDTERMRITSGGNVFVNSTSGYTATGRIGVVVNGSTQSIFGLQTGGVNKAYFFNDGSNTLIYSEDGSGYMAFGTANSERMRITSGGNVLIGTTTDNGARLQINGVTSSAGYRQDTGAVTIGHNTATNIYTNSGIRGLYLVYVSLPAGDGAVANYTAYAIIAFDTSASRIMQQTDGLNLFITLSGNNVQARQTSGGVQSVEFRIIKIV
jgi:hypothetical protein